MSESSTLSEHDVKPAANKPSRTTRTLFLRILIFILFICFYIISTATRHFHTSQHGKRTHKNMYVTIKRPKSREYFLFYTKNNHTFLSQSVVSVKYSKYILILFHFLYKFHASNICIGRNLPQYYLSQKYCRQLSTISLKGPKRILFT